LDPSLGLGSSSWIAFAGPAEAAKRPKIAEKRTEPAEKSEAPDAWKHWV